MCSSSACAGFPSCVNQSMVGSNGGAFGCSSAYCYSSCGVSACASMCSDESCNGLVTIVFSYIFDIYMKFINGEII